MTVAQVKITIVKPRPHLSSQLVRFPIHLRRCPHMHTTVSILFVFVQMMHATIWLQKSVMPSYFEV